MHEVVAKVNVRTIEEGSMITVIAGVVAVVVVVVVIIIIIITVVYNM